MQLPSRFAERLLQARRRKNLDQHALGDKVGLTGYTIGRLERQQTKQISIEALRKLVWVLEVSADWLLAIEVPSEEETEQLIAASYG